MAGSAHILTVIFSVLTLVSMAGSLIMLYALAARSSLGERIMEFIAPKSLWLAFLISLAGVIGSLLFAQVAGYVSCDLCWYERIFLYPQAIMFFMAFWRKDRSIVSYSIVLSIAGALAALYQVYADIMAKPLCIAAAVSCGAAAAAQWGFITVPVMSLAAFIGLIVLMLCFKRTRSTLRTSAF
jgi:disulfide bond formation protein DsbB